MPASRGMALSASPAPRCMWAQGPCHEAVCAAGLRLQARMQQQLMQARMQQLMQPCLHVALHAVHSYSPRVAAPAAHAMAGRPRTRWPAAAGM